MSVKEKPHFTVSAETLAAWLESHPERWWSVDGDPVLTSVVDFPCPADELVPAIRKVNKPLLLQDKDPASGAHGEPITGDRLDDLCSIGGRRKQEVLLLSWADSDIDWLLIEDEPLVEK